MIRGRILWADPERLLLARDATLLESTDRGGSWSRVGKLPLRDWRECSVRLPYGARLTRSGFHHALVGPAGQIVCIAHRDVFVAGGGAQLERVASLHGSRPLIVCATDEAIYYGEYRGNPERTPVGVWRAEFARPERWERVWTFEHIRHVHGVHRDPWTDDLWVTTGDLDDEAGLWRTRDDFGTLEHVAGGSQQLRAVQLVFTRDHVYFGSDAPEEINAIQRLERRSGRIERLVEVGGPVFFGTRRENMLCFSTVVEPSAVNRSHHAELWCSADGTRWERRLAFRKDSLPMKLFQYAQIRFPNGPGDSRNLWVTPFATACDGRSIAVPLS